MLGSSAATIHAAAGAAPYLVRLTTRQRLTLVGSVSGISVAAIVGSQAVEFFINRVLRPDLEEWSWISEVLMTLAFLAITTLWIRLRLANTTVEALEHERLRSQAELAVAANVQRALLPAIPAPLRGVSWFAAMEPAGVVGGDYFDFFPLAGDRMGVVVADVSGKGVPAAVFVSNARAVIRAVAREPTATPSQILRSVSEVVLADSRGDLYVTAFVAIVDATLHTMRFANAGHPPAVVIGQSTRALTAGGPPLGLFADARYDEELVMLEPNDLVVIVSDGITDGLNATGDGIAPAIAAAVGRRNRTPESACGAILAEARRGPGPADVETWTDDRTVLAFSLPSSFD